MPFDAAIASRRSATLSEILENHGIVPVPWERLAAHKQSQLEAHPPSFWYRHQGLLRVGVFVSFIAVAPISALTAYFSSFLPCFVGFGWLVLLLPAVATLRLRAGAHWEEHLVLESSLGRIGVPDLGRGLRGQRVEAEGRQQANDPVRYALARLDQALMLAGLGIGQDVDAPARAIEYPLGQEANEVLTRDVMSGQIPSAQHAMLANKAQKLLCSGLHHVA